MNATKSTKTKPYKDADGIADATETLVACCNAVQPLVEENGRISSYVARQACATVIGMDIDEPVVALYAGMTIATLMRDRKVMFSDGANGPEIIDRDSILR